MTDPGRFDNNESSTDNEPTQPLYPTNPAHPGSTPDGQTSVSQTSVGNEPTQPLFPTNPAQPAAQQPRPQPPPSPMPGSAAPQYSGWGSNQQGWGPQQPGGSPVPGGYPPPGYGPGPAGYSAMGYAPSAQRHPSATTALVLGILSIIGFFICFFGAALGPLAWWLGSKSVNEIDATGGQMDGRSEAQAGRIMGIISTVLLILGVVVIIVFFIILASAGDFGGTALAIGRQAA